MALLSDTAGAAKNIARIIIDAIQWTIANVRFGLRFQSVDATH